MKIIKLTQGKATYVDDCDYERVSRHKWCAFFSGDSWYAVSRIAGKFIYMHRLILNPPDGVLIDHRDGHTLDNRRFNIRLCTNQQNCWNSRSRQNTLSKYRGVSFDKRANRAKRWYARITVNGKKKFLGFFDSEEDAARAFNIAAKKYFGEFARLNVIVKPGESYSLFA